MMHPKEMSMLRIITPSKYVNDVVESLYDLKLLHIVDFKKGEKEFLDIGKPLKEANIYSEQLIDLRSIISRLKITGTPKNVKNFKDAQKKFSLLNKEFKDIVKTLDEIKTVEAGLMEQAKNPLSNLDITKDKVKAYKSLAGFMGVVKSPIEPKLKPLTSDYILIGKKSEKQISFALFVKREFESKVKDILTEIGFTEYGLPELNKEELNNQLSKVRKEILNLETQLNNFKQEKSQFIVDYEFALSQLNEKAEVPLRFASSKRTLIATGWIPNDKAEQLKQTLSSVAREKISVEFQKGENPPTVLHNPNLANPFEFLLDLYSLPKYYEIDPTILMFFTFPLFFGFMLGDVGYGVTTLLITLALERMMPIGVKPLLRIILIASLASIAFGFIFGEFFGYDFIKHPLLNRVEDVSTMMLIAVAVGVVHINFGFILGFINELRHHGLVLAFLRKISWILLQISAAIFAFGFLKTNQSFEIIGGVLSVVSVFMIIKGEGILRIVELPALLSNILSYIRLYAIGLSSVSLALIFNKLATGFFTQGGISIVFGVSILLLGHLINLLLGLLGPFLHSMRLHYVEFFQKFYEGGGYKYSPFGIVKIGGR